MSINDAEEIRTLFKDFKMEEVPTSYPLLSLSPGLEDRS